MVAGYQILFSVVDKCLVCHPKIGQICPQSGLLHSLIIQWLYTHTPQKDQCIRCVLSSTSLSSEKICMNGMGVLI
jgi:hypothetical protein